jgi:thiosulfate dehydrogenase (quinone) large subunit
MSTTPALAVDRAASLANTFAYWSLRLWLGLRCFVTGLDKYAGRVREQVPLLDEFGEPDITGAMVEVERKVYAFSHYTAMPRAMAERLAAEPLMPAWAMSLYSALLGPIMIIVGITLLLGVAPRVSLFVMGLIYTSLTIGLIFLNENGGVAWLGIHVLMVVAALRLIRHDRFSLVSRW